MQKLLKLGLFVAAGYGTYEILRRAGLLYKAGEWLQDNVPEEVQAKVRDHMQQTRDQAQRLRGQATGQLQNLKARAGEQYGQAVEAVTNKYNGIKGGTPQPASGAAAAQADDGGQGGEPVTDVAHQTGQTITGPGRGVDDATVEVNGGSVHHRVGRGVVHG